MRFNFPILQFLHSIILFLITKQIFIPTIVNLLSTTVQYYFNMIEVNFIIINFRITTIKSDFIIKFL